MHPQVDVPARIGTAWIGLETRESSADAVGRLDRRLSWVGGEISRMNDDSRAPSDADRIAAFHELLVTMTRAPNVREVFQYFSQIARRIVVHDEANLALATDDGAAFRLYATTMDGDAEVIHAGDHVAVQDPSVPSVFRDGVGSERGFQSGIRVPVRADGQPIGVLAFLSRQQDAYSERELVLAQRIADYVAVALSHQRLAEAARHVRVESSVDLLRTIAEVLDIRRVFPRVSEITNQVLPHDCMHLVFEGKAGQGSLQASSHNDFPAHGRVTRAADPAEPDFRIVGDLRTAKLPVIDPPDFQDRVLAAGYGSLLGVGSVARDQQMGLAFWSKRLNA
jgi:hypothetical protein